MLYYLKDPKATLGSSYGKPNKTVQVSGAVCMGSEAMLQNCSLNLIPPDEGRGLYQYIDAAGVNCFAPDSTSATQVAAVSSAGAAAGVSVLAIVLVVVIVVIVG